jgi:hypothetical protein
MKTLRWWIALVVVGIAAALFFGRSRVETGAVDRPWPYGLGVVADAPKRYPPAKTSEAATKLMTLARNAQVSLRYESDRRSVDDDTREAFADYVRTQLGRGNDTIDAPPDAVTRWLADNAAPLDEIRALARGGEPIVFESDIAKGRYEVQGPNLAGLQHLHRVFVARALVAKSWDELHAAWGLVRPLWSRPDTMAVLTASTGARMINSAAAKLPLPPPAWFREIETFPYERMLASAHQAEAWRAKTAAFNVRVRGMAEEVLRSRACDSSSEQFEAVRKKLGSRAAPSLVEAWERLMRFRAEREFTARVMQMRQGQPVSPQSQCSDGSWKLSRDGFQFSRDIAVEEPQIKYALQYSRTR